MNHQTERDHLVQQLDDLGWRIDDGPNHLICGPAIGATSDVHKITVRVVSVDGTRHAHGQGEGPDRLSAEVAALRNALGDARTGGSPVGLEHAEE